MWEKLKELGMSRMGMILLAGVLVFILSHLLGVGQEEKRENREGTMIDNRSVSGDMQDPTMRYIQQQEERLEAILAQIEGIGQVEVMISVSASREKVILSDNPYDQKTVEEQDAAGGTRVTKEVSREDETIYESNGSGQTPYVIKELEPELAGVLVLAEGADNAVGRTEIVEAVEALFGLPAHRIKVIKRRG